MFDNRHITVMARVLYLFSRYLGPYASSRRTRIFLRVAEYEPITLAEITKLVKAPSGTIYDDLRALGKAGAHVIQEIPGGPGEPASRFCVSSRGKRLLGAMKFEMEGMCDAPQPQDADEAEPRREYFEAKRHTRG